MEYPGTDPSQGRGQGFLNKFQPDSKLLTAATAQLQSYIRTNIIDGDTRELDRITKYYLYWKFYEGYHYKDLNESMLSFNYVAAFIDKILMFLLGKDAFSIQVKNLMTEQVDTDFEKLVGRALNYHWNKSKKSAVTHEILQMGSVSGDVWIMPEWQEVGNYVKVKCLDSRQCFPIFRGGDFNDVESFVVRFALDSNANIERYRLFCYQFTPDKVFTWYQKDTASGPSTKKYEPTEDENPYGFIPIVHIKNKPFSPGYFSKSDMVHTMKINKVYNEMSQQQKAVIDYHSTPTTVITGGVAKNLQRGLGKIWSGLPPEANVFNLGLDVDLSALQEFLRTIKASMHELSDVPENAMGKIQAISNTSAAALNITYQPLVQQADLKAITYGDGFTELNTMILFLAEYHDPKSELLLPIKAVDPEYLEVLRAEPVFTYGLPQDRQNELNMGLSEINAHIGSRKEIMNRLGKHNIPELMDEIQKDIDDDMGNQARAANVMATATAPDESGKVPALPSSNGKKIPELKVPLKNNESVNGKFTQVKKA